MENYCNKVLETSRRFWDVMEHADEAGMREIADPACQFVHIGVTAGLAACGNRQSGSGETSSRNEGQSNETETSKTTESSRQEGESSSEAAAGTQKESSAEMPVETSEASEGKTLVVYYSASGNTKEVADYIASAMEGDLFEIVPTEIYTGADLDWTDEDSRVSREHNNEDERIVPLVSDTVDNWEEYDTVFIGFAGGIIGLNQEKPINQGFALV